MRALWVLVLMASAAAFASTGDEAWPGEQRRFRVGLGLRGIGGAMFQRGATFLLLQSQAYVAGELRVGRHHAVRLQLAATAGWPGAFEGETNLSFMFGLSPRLRLGVGVFGAVGISSLRGGLEVPLVARFGGRGAHELSLAFRLSPGAFNNVTFVWWDFQSQAFALSVEGALGYTFFF